MAPYENQLNATKRQFYHPIPTWIEREWFVRFHRKWGAKKTCFPWLSLGSAWLIHHSTRLFAHQPRQPAGRTCALPQPLTGACAVHEIRECQSLGGGCLLTRWFLHELLWDLRKIFDKLWINGANDFLGKKNIHIVYNVTKLWAWADRSKWQRSWWKPWWVDLAFRGNFLQLWVLFWLCDVEMLACL